MQFCFVLLVAQVLLGASTLQEKLDAVLSASEAGRRAFWGIRVINLANGATMYERHADHFFVPASNTKLFTTALALDRLGPEHTFITRVIAEREPDFSGRLAGDLVLYGGGDPTLSAREIPYQKGPVRGDPLRAMEELAGQLAARGVRRIDGNVVGDDRRYAWEPYPDGWAIGDAVWEYGAPVSALSLGDNAQWLTVQPAAAAGDPAVIRLRPPLEYYAVDNRVTTAPAGGEPKLAIAREPGSRQLRVWGRIPVRGSARTWLVAIDDPALFAAIALRDALIRRGVAVGGRALSKHQRTTGIPETSHNGQPSRAEVELARRVSPPLRETLRIVNKVSQNLHAELLLREVALVRRKTGTRQAGLAEMKVFLAEAGIKDTEYEFTDGSGLSRRNLVTPAAVTRLLAHMDRYEHRGAWLASLPVGGEDGTLSDRFQRQAAGKRIRAKTGTLGHVSALSGYAETRSGDRLAFSILVNNYTAQTSAVRNVIDTICTLLVE